MCDGKNIRVLRGVGHPWDDQGAWDRLVLEAPDKGALAALVARAKARFWKVWIEDDMTAAAVLYKPSGARSAWTDPMNGGQGLPAL